MPSFHPTLNKSRRFKQCKRYGLNSVWEKYKKNPLFIFEFAALIAKNLNLIESNRTKQSDVLTRLTYHKNFRAYNHKQEFFDLLERIYGLMSGTITDPTLNFDKTKIPLYAEKLYEGLSACTAGAHVRAIALWEGWAHFPKSFAERLENFREDIVMRVARSMSTNVHAQNTVTKMAESVYGIRCTHANDPYQGHIDPLQVTNKLHHAFINEYTPMQIIMALEEQILSQLLSEGYTGRRNPNDAYGKDVKTGYCAGKWMDILNATFPQANVPIESWVITLGSTKPQNNDIFDPNDDLALDVNWPLIRQHIIQQLLREKLFHPFPHPRHVVNFSNVKEREYYFLNFSDEKEQLDWLNTYKTLPQLLVLSQKIPSGHPLLQKIKPKIMAHLQSAHLVAQLHAHPILCTNSAFTEMLIAIIQQSDPEQLKMQQVNHLALLDIVLKSKNQPLIEQFVKFIDNTTLDWLEKYVTIDELLVLLHFIPESSSLFSQVKEKIKSFLASQTNLAAYLEPFLRQNQKYFKYFDTPHTVSLLINAIKSFNPKDLFNHRSSVNCNLFLMLSVGNNPSLLNHFIEYLGEISKEELQGWLFYMNKFGLNAMSVLCQKVQLTSDALLKLIPICDAKGIEFPFDYLESFQKIKEPKATLELIKLHLLVKIRKNAFSDIQVILETAIQHHPQFLVEILKDLNVLSLEQKASILKPIPGKDNLLMVASQYHAAAIPQLVEFIKGSFAEESSSKLLLKDYLLQKNSLGDNSLLLAVKHQPKAVEETLKITQFLNLDEVKFTQYSQQESSGINAFIYAVYKNLDATVPLLAEIQSLPVADQARIFATRTNTKWNVLEAAAEYSPENIPGLVNALSLLPNQTTLVDMFSSPNKSNALARVCNANPQSTPEIMKLVLRLPEAKKNELLTSTSFSNLEAPTLVELLRMAKQHPGNALLVKKVWLNKDIFSAKDWFNIANEGLVSSQLMKKQKRVVYRYIKSMTENRADVVKKSLDAQSHLGSLFFMQRGFFACKRHTGTLKKLAKLDTLCGAVTSHPVS